MSFKKQNTDMNDWFDEEESEEARRERESQVGLRRERTRGEMEGLKEGIDAGEIEGFKQAFREAAAKAFVIGRALGAARIAEITLPSPQLAEAKAQLEAHVARGDSHEESSAALAVLTRILKEMGVDLEGGMTIA